MIESTVANREDNTLVEIIAADNETNSTESKTAAAAVKSSTEGNPVLEESRVTECISCGKAFTSREFVKRLINVHNGEIMQTALTNRNTSKCKECQEEFPRPKDLLVHNNLKHLS